MNRSYVSLFLGSLAWTIYLRSAASFEHAEVFAWVADRDAGCVVALDSDLLELESWKVSRPTALVVSGGRVLVQSLSEGSESWWRLESGSNPVSCAARAGARNLKRVKGPLPTGLQGEPTAWARAKNSHLVATPGALHLCSEDGVLRRVQGGFRWISSVATSTEGLVAPER